MHTRTHYTFYFFVVFFFLLLAPCTRFLHLFYYLSIKGK